MSENLILRYNNMITPIFYPRNGIYQICIASIDNIMTTIHNPNLSAVVAHDHLQAIIRDASIAINKLFPHIPTETNIQILLSNVTERLRNYYRHQANIDISTPEAYDYQCVKLMYVEIPSYSKLREIFDSPINIAIAWMPIIAIEKYDIQ